MMIMKMHLRRINLAGLEAVFESRSDMYIDNFR